MHNETQSETLAGKVGSLHLRFGKEDGALMPLAHLRRGPVQRQPHGIAGLLVKMLEHAIVEGLSTS
jgi:hypothetical protein